MCGFAGIIDPSRCVEQPEATLEAMARCIVHRGPDDAGVSFDPSLRVGLAFRRLAILDLSPAGHQPMRSASGRYEIAFNGEVYNHGELRDGLAAQGASFRGHSDTEAMLAAFEADGVEASLARFNGMFAFAVVDRVARTAWIVRDRFGVKPLHYGCTHGRAVPAGDFAIGADHALVFASELSSLRAVREWRGSIDRGALTLYMRHGYIPGPLSIHPEARKLRPGHLLRIDLAARTVEERCWWHSRDLARRGAAQPFAGGEEEAIDAVDRALTRSVALRMVADVPVGAFLSGGIDSSAVVAAMQAQSARPVRTFTIGFGQPEFDEAPYARAIASHLGTDHTEVYISPEQARATVPDLARIWDEPFADSSQMPTLLVSGIARRAVTVSLSGDGGDELFGGYYRYSWTREVAARTRRLPPAMRAAAAAILRATPRSAANRIGASLARLMPSRLGFDRAGDRAHKLARLLRDDDPWSIYLRLVAIIDDAPSIVLGGHAPATALTDPVELAGELPLELRMMQADIASYLVDDILVKVDRASMAHSLEAREPLLDPDLAELAFSLPLSMKIRGGERKWILRRVLERRVPRSLFERPKMGFGVPLAEWLRGPLRGWAEDLLDPARLRQAGYLDADAVRAIWSRTLDPRMGSNGYEAWNLLMFESWRDRWSY
ncbi:MAG: hypothetical protein RL136_439 [Planctomycetota bacterium]|jgi:asparagine synthase (glutamine-hydrolysing)